jgi:flagellar export protein FliJ
MKRFRFRLESIRALRDVAERKAREGFGLAQQQVRLGQQTLEATEARRSELNAAITSARSGNFRPSEQVAGLAALGQADREVAEARRKLGELEKARDLAREGWLTARRALQVMQKLEERARLAHREACDKAEQTLLDDIASMTLARQGPLA